MKKAIFYSSIIFLIFLNDCYAQDLFKIPAGTRALEVVDLLNNKSSQILEDYINNHYTPGFRDAFPMASHRSIYHKTQTMFGRVKVVDITKSTQNAIELIVKSEKKEAWLKLVLQVESDDPHRIVSIGLIPCARPGTSETVQEKTRQKQKVSSDKPAERKQALFSNLDGLHQYLLKRAGQNEFSGTVLIAKQGYPVFQNAYGYASKRFGTPNKVDTKFNLGSINKIFTTVAITQLMEKGRLSMDDPIGKYLEMFPQEIGDKVLIRHLINMKSGWGDYWGNEYYLSNKDHLRTVSDYMDFIKDIPIDFEPGTNFQHSNIGYEVAGAIIEAVSNMDYFDYVRKNIYEPSGMTNTDSYYRDGPVENLAVGYTNMNQKDPKGKGYQWNNTYMLPPRGTPAGGGHSTGEDLLKFSRALRNYRLLNAAYTQYLISRFQTSPGGAFSPPEKMYRMVGGAPGINAFLGIDFQSSYSIIVLSNYDFPTAMDVAEEIIRMLGLE